MKRKRSLALLMPRALRPQRPRSVYAELGNSILVAHSLRMKLSAVIEGRKAQDQGAAKQLARLQREVACLRGELLERDTRTAGELQAALLDRAPHLAVLPLDELEGYRAKAELYLKACAEAGRLAAECQQMQEALAEVGAQLQGLQRLIVEEDGGGECH